MDRACQAFQDLDPDWDGIVTPVWLEETYYGFVRTWRLETAHGAYLVSPSQCNAPFDQLPDAR
jgi:hypothetical protein